MPEPGAPPPHLRLRDLGHAYGPTQVLDGVSLEVAQGELLAVLGPSGCGKTTLLRALAGLLTPARGRIEIQGRVVAEGGRERVPCEARGVGLVFQEYALFPTLTVGDNLAFGLRRPDPDRVAGLLQRVGLAELADRRPAQLSGGQQQRVALARALAPAPAVLLLDEPFANVDAARRDELGALLRSTVAEAGVAGVLVTHDQEAALGLADRVAVLLPGPRGGRLAQLAPPEEIYRQPASWAVATLTGAAWSRSGEAGLEAVRPEDTGLVADPQGDCTVVHSVFLGRCHRVELAGPEGRVLADADRRWRAGERARVEVRRSWPLPES